MATKKIKRRNCFMGQSKRYTHEMLHPFRHFSDYVNEVKAGAVAPYRVKVLQERLANVKTLAKQMYCDAYILIQKLDGEWAQDPEYLWNLELKLARYRTSKDSDGNYSKKKLHPIRHFEEYVEKIEAGNFSSEDRKKFKNRLAKVMRLAPEVYCDADQLLKELI